MPRYCVNKNAQSNGDHEVHNVETCNNLPLSQNQLDLGYHTDCKGAVREAKKTYSTANGCAFCSPACNTG